MLRNPFSIVMAVTKYFLNEVLSLNAQEYDAVTNAHWQFVVLNEVLSLNAQESVVSPREGDPQGFPQ